MSIIDNLGRAVLYSGMMKDMGLCAGDGIVFVRNGAGRWEVRSAYDVARDMQELTDNAKADLELRIKELEEELGDGRDDAAGQRCAGGNRRMGQGSGQ